MYLAAGKMRVYVRRSDAADWPSVVVSGMQCGVSATREVIGCITIELCREWGWS